MRSYVKELARLFELCINNETIVDKLKKKDKNRFYVYRHRIRNDVPISEQVMRETVEKYMSVEIKIVQL